MNRRLYLLIFFVTIILCMGGYLLYLRSFQSIEIQYANGLSGVKTLVYVNNHSEEESSTPSDAIAETTGSIQLRVKRGGYRIITTETAQYEGSDQIVALGSNPVKIKVDPDFSDKKNQELLSQESAFVKNALLAQYPDFESLYRIDRELISNKGQWYGATLKATSLVPELTNDNLRFIAKKAGPQKWVIVTSPPYIVISKISHPDIPPEFVDRINKLSAD